jgi:hypothetical protein
MNIKQRKNFFTLDIRDYKKSNPQNIKRAVDILNEDKLVIIT